MRGKTDMARFLEIGLLRYPDAQEAAIHGLQDLFDVANRMADTLGAAQAPRVRISVWRVGEEGNLQPEPPLEDSNDVRLRVLIIPPSLHAIPDDACLARHRSALCRLHQQGTVLACVCIGVFFIAACGLLNGRAACAHRTHVQILAARYAYTRAEAQQALLDDGVIVSSAGLMAWTSLGLCLVQRFMGNTVAAETANFLAVEPVPDALPGTRLNPSLDHGDEAVLKVQHWLQATGARTADLAAMAACACLEPRTFLRRFRLATALRPTEYCQQIRVCRAARLLEFTRRTVDQIAWDVGYRDPGAFRKVFQRATGLTPSAFRRQRIAPRPGGRVEVNSEPLDLDIG
ncbi:GlxA family transcriptional regulator [Pseudomonas fulva]|uniref:GlxA family transcriptional regulator n=1 Tax=Pseudomonas fulva TaxID=47880 RepID=UPI0038517F5A